MNITHRLAGLSVCTVRSAVYMSCLMPTKMLIDANTLCLDELVRSQVDSWAIKDHPLNANFTSSECRL